MNGLWLRLTLSLVAVALLALCLEVGLRLAGFSAPLQPIVIAGREGVAKADGRGFITDARLGFAFEPGGLFRGRAVNRYGFLGREVAEVVPANVCRVLCMGDSCTAQGEPPYADLLHNLLQAEPPTAESWEAFNMAVHGYSTEHAIRLFREQGRRFQPDYVTLYYGWNDHWKSAQTDYRTLPKTASRWCGALLRLSCHFRLYQFVASRARIEPERDAKNLVLRVPPEHYRRNLQTLVHEIREAGAVPILITAPRGRHLTPILVAHALVASEADAVRLHDEYCAISREVAEQTGAPLLDLERTFREEQADALFSDDGIHFKDEGRQRIAEEIHALLLALETEP